MVLPTEDAGVATGPNIKRPRSGRALKVRRSCDGAVPSRAADYFDGAKLLLVGLRRSFTAGLSTLIKDHLAGGASRLAALLGALVVQAGDADLKVRTTDSRSAGLQACDEKRPSRGPAALNELNQHGRDR